MWNIFVIQNDTVNPLRFVNVNPSKQNENLQVSKKKNKMKICPKIIL